MTSIDTETLFELWEKVKEYIPAKDKLDAAETFVKLCDDAGMEKDVRMISAISSIPSSQRDTM